MAKNTEQLHSQWLYNKYTRIIEDGAGIVEIDNTQMPEEAYSQNMLGNMVLKIRLAKDECITSAMINDELVPAFFWTEDFHFFYLPILEQKKYCLEYQIGSGPMPLHVFNEGTYNVYELKKKAQTVDLVIKMYGTQTIKIKCTEPHKILTNTAGLSVKNFQYVPSTGMLEVIVSAADMQGTKGELQLLY